MEVRKNVRDPFRAGDLYRKIYRDEYVLDAEEVKIIVELLRTKIKVLENRYEKYFGLYDAGEATNRDTDELEKVKEQLGVLESIINVADDIK